MSDVYELRRELEALEGLVATAGWARVVEHFATEVELARAVTERWEVEEKQRLHAVARISIAGEVARWPGERIGELREEIARKGGVE